LVNGESERIQAIKKLVEKNPSFQEMGRNAQEYVQEYFSVTNFISQHSHVYEKNKA
jgi:hypothetical protein